jgi:hypothetical protein
MMPVSLRNGWMGGWVLGRFDTYKGEYIVGLGLARAASAMTSVSTVAHPADSCHGLSDAHAIGKYHDPKSKHVIGIRGHGRETISIQR